MTTTTSIGALDRFDPESIRTACLGTFDVMIQMRPVCGCTEQDSDEIRGRLSDALRFDGSVVALVSALEAGNPDPRAIRFALDVLVGEFVAHASRDDETIPPPEYDGTAASTLKARSREAEKLLTTLEQDAVRDVALEPLEAIVDALHERAGVAERVERNRAARGRRDRGGAPAKISTDVAARLETCLRDANTPKRHDLIARVMVELFGENVNGEAVRNRLKSRERSRTRSKRY